MSTTDKEKEEEEKTLTILGLGYFLIYDSKFVVGLEETHMKFEDNLTLR